MKKIIAVVAGLFFGAVLMTIVQMLGHRIYPQPEGMDPSDMEALSAYVETAPFMALFFVIISYGVAALASGWISTKIAGDGNASYALICGGIFLIQAIFMMSSLPTPFWFWVLGIAIWGLVYVGYYFARPRASFSSLR